MNGKGQDLSGVGMFLGIILVVAFFWVLMSFSIIQYNDYGVVKSFFGKLDSDIRTQGIVYKGMFSSMLRVNNQIRNSELIVKATSTDLQDVSVELNLNMKIKPDKTYDFIKNYKTEEQYMTYLNNKMQERIKVVVLKYKAEQFIYNRLNISQEIGVEVRNIKELDYFEVNDVSIKNIEFSEEFTKTLERKAQVDIEREIIVKQNENVALVNKNIALIPDMDDYFKYQIAEKWNGASSLTMIGGLQ